MPRLFIALDLPEEVARALGSLQNEELDVKWVDPSKIHLTLRFLGDAEADRIGGLEEGLSAIDAPSFEVAPTGLGVFPSRRSPSVLWVGIEEERALYELQESVEAAVVDLGFEAENRSFTPHLTIARCRSADPKQIRRFMRKHESFSAPSFTCSTFHLYKSELHPDGAQYTRLASYELTGES